MTSVGSISSTISSESTTDSASLLDDYDTFLTLLVTQLQNQDPTDPMDVTEFTDQLVQYSAIEQQIKTNDLLEQLGEEITMSNALNAVNFVGTTVTVDGSKGYLDDYGGITYSFSSEEEGTATVTIYDEDGDEVYSESDVTIYGDDQTLYWDGNDNDGTACDTGMYTIEITASNDDGDEIEIDTDYTGTVEAVDLSSSEALLLVDDSYIEMSQIKSVDAS